MTTTATSESKPTITGTASLPVRLGAWLAERHGPVLLVPILLIYGISIAAGATAPEAVAVSSANLVIGAVAAWLWFLALRVLDDLGDREADAIAHPDRLLQRGVVTPGELGGLAAVAVALMAISCLVADGGIGPVTLTWLAALLITGVVSSDRAAPPALRSRPMLHRLLRVPCSALPVLWWFQLGSGGTGLTWTAAVLGLVSILTVVVFDIARKLEPATAEGQSSWGDTLGERRAHAVLAGALAALGATCAGLLAACDVLSVVPLVVLAVAVLGPGAAVVRGASKLAPLVLLLLLLTTLVTLVVAG